MRKLLVLALVCAAAPARADFAAFGTISEGLAQDGSGIHHASGGGLYTIGRFGLEAQLDIASMTRWDADRGTSGYGGGLSARVRYGFMDDKMSGLYANAGASYLFLADGADKRINGSGLGLAPVGSHAFALGIGLAYGFRPSAHTTVSVRLDANMWFFDVGDYPPETPDPHPHPLSVGLGLEFIRWI